MFCIHFKLYQVHGTKQVSNLKEFVIGWDSFSKINFRQEDIKNRRQYFTDFNLTVIVVDFHAVKFQKFVVVAMNKC